MAHFAELNQDNEVIRVVVVNNSDILVNGVESEQKGVEFLSNLLGGLWKQTSYSGSFRKRYAGPGMVYVQDLDAFIDKKPFDSWTLNPETYLWEAPVKIPKDGKKYDWDEENQEWIRRI